VIIARMSPVRVLDLDGSCNFRDCGGYGTRDGARVRWGRLYRSGVMAGMTPAATARLASLGVRAVCDLRRTQERSRHPNPGLGAGVRVFEWDTPAEASIVKTMVLTGSADKRAAHAVMLQFYRELPYTLQPRLAGAFAALEHAAGECATIVHCSAGKDRTGIAVALVLETLGVPRETILEDYLLTATAVDLRRQLLGRAASGLGLAESASRLLQLPQHALQALLAVHPDYLQAGLGAIEARHGSVRGYVQEELGVSPATLSRLRDLLLE
jgi:protein-tyrosine phosphatase